MMSNEFSEESEDVMGVPNICIEYCFGALIFSIA